jgi:hypothetical protein
MTGKNKPDVAYLAIRFSLEFVVVVVGISVSFWVNEWSDEREAIRQRTTDASELLDDLNIDGTRIDKVLGAIQQGKHNTSRIMRNHRLMREGVLDYAAFADSLYTIGYAYRPATFFMNDGTYKSLINNARLQGFSSEHQRDIKGYYEYVFKRVDDHNELVDDIGFNYPIDHHPMTLLTEEDYFGESNGKDLCKRSTAIAYLMIPEVRRSYEDIRFYNATIALRNRVFVHENQIALFNDMRQALMDKLEALTQSPPE